MKKWIHASTENIDQKIKDYLAAWAHDNVKAGEEACSLKDFREQLKDDGLKFTDTRYDYYLQCYNRMNGAKNDSKEKVESSTSTRDRISELEEKIEILEEYLYRNQYEDPEERIDDQIELAELKEQLNFAWQDDEEEYNYAVQQQEFNPDGSLKLYGSTKSKRSVRCSSEKSFRGVDIADMRLYWKRHCDLDIDRSKYPSFIAWMNYLRDNGLWTPPEDTKSDIESSTDPFKVEVVPEANDEDDNPACWGVEFYSESGDRHYVWITKYDDNEYIVEDSRGNNLAKDGNKPLTYRTFATAKKKAFDVAKRQIMRDFFTN